MKSRRGSSGRRLSKFKGAIRKALRGRPEVIFAILYGSALETPHFRDLDVGVFVERDQVSLKTDLDYALTLSDVLTVQLGFPVDVRVINDAPPGFRYNVSRGETLLVNDEEALARFRERTWDEWLDFEPVARLYLREIVG